MPRKLTSTALATRSARAKLPARTKVYVVRIIQGYRLGYRKNATTCGSWSAIGATGDGDAWVKKIGLADDTQDADGRLVLSFDQAVDVVRAMSRGPGEESGDRPALVKEAIARYRLDLIARGAEAQNADRLARHIPAALGARPVASLTAREVRTWRNSLLDAGLSRGSANRSMKAFCAAMSLAAKDDARITNTAAWKLEGLPDAVEARNTILSDVQVRAVISASYNVSDAFGMLIETLAVLGSRPSQIKRCTVGDLELNHADGPRLHVPSARKGRGVKRSSKTALPIPEGLARRLGAAAAGRPDDAALLLDPTGRDGFTRSGHAHFWRLAATAAKLPPSATCYALRHSAIVRGLLVGTPTRLVAAAADTSVSMLERHYAKYIVAPGAAYLRQAAEALDIDARAPGNVVPMGRKPSARPRT
jgi:hypothetical protein